MSRRVTDEHIVEFTSSHGCSNVMIMRPPPMKNGRSIKISYTCKCGRIGGTKWSNFVKKPRCKLCGFALNKRISDEVLRETLLKSGIEFVSSRREEINGKSRLFIKFICSCDKDTTRIIEESTWDKLKYGSKCLKCCKIRAINTNMERYGVSNVFMNEEFKEKSRKTMLERYGAEHNMQSEEIKQKIAATNIEKYGSACASKNYKVKEKARNTMIERYGTISTLLVPKFREKYTATMLEKYGTCSSLQIPKFRAKYKQTMIERYGVEYPMHNHESREKQAKSAFRIKSYTFENGREVKYQGYEHLAYDRLIYLGYHIDDILSESEIVADNSIPDFWYELNGKRHRYFPDIYIKSEEKIIEVKSTWTANLDPKQLECKMQCIIDAGFDIEVWIFDKKGNLTVW